MPAAQGLGTQPAAVPQLQDDGLAAQPLDSAGLLTAISDLTSEFGKLNATETDASAANNDANQEVYDDGEWTRSPPLLEEKEVPNEVAWDCTGDRELTYETNWYHLPDTPEFLICTNCHERFVRGTKLSEHTEKVRLSGGKCRFNVPRLTDQLIPQLRQDGDIEPIREYMARRLQIVDCKGLGAVERSEGLTWYHIAEKPEGVMGLFAICMACYEDHIVPTSYTHLFDSHSPETTGEQLICDLCFDYIKRSIRDYSRKGKPFSEWMVTAEKRYKLPRCEGKAVESASRSWVRPRETVENFVICETCYYEKIALTCLDAGFEYIPVPKSKTGSEWMDAALGYRTEPETSWICDAPDSAISEALLAAMKRRDMSLFIQGAKSYIAGPPCTKDGITGGTWYTLVGGCDNYNVCSLCYTCCVEAWGLERFYQKAETTGSPDVILCNFNLASPRFMPCMLKLSQAMETGVWSVFSNFVKTYLKIALCPRSENLPNLRWYGYDDCLICEECYESFCKDNSPGPGVELQHTGVVLEVQRMCCMYSPRMRGKWLEACEKGDATDLIEFSRHRHGVYVQTVPQIQMLRQMQEIKMMQGMHAGYMSVVYQGIQGIQSVSGTTDGYLHGNSSLGWHETEAGATSAQFFNQMGSDFREANSSGSWMAIFRLAAMWDEVE
ncbi:hypothetical protein GQ53DRAFT_711896 [Thozetella sp. PMI_491]|nr:hypothetical protein GQ53DRAFT_711896 [Thozetella sp. PMI_491]